MAPILCKDCKFFISSDFSSLLAKCDHPKSRAKDVVRGEPDYADHQRGYGSCGYGAKNFVPKDGYTFPDAPVMPTKTLVFDDTSLVKRFWGSRDKSFDTTAALLLAGMVVIGLIAWFA